MKNNNRDCMNQVKHQAPMKNSKVFTMILVYFFLSLVLALSFGAREVFANNLTFDNFNVYATNEASNTITFVSDVSWDNSWRSISNYDAIWVFLKYSTDGGATWSHASMGGNGTNPSGFYVPLNFETIVPEDEKGFFLQRSDLSSGNVTASGVRFVGDYGQDGLTDETAMAANTINRIFGVEMVYVPQGSFHAGDGNSSSEYRFIQGSTDNDPWYIQSESAFSTSNATSDAYYYQSTGATGESSSGSSFLLPTSFPKGYQAFYFMKYELTEGQWVSFFNTLSTAAKTNRDITGSSNGGKNSDSVVNRNTVSWDSSNAVSKAAMNRADRPVSYISWPDLLSYADWAGLRPVTELEYEKVSRGKDVSPQTDEFAWGNALYNTAGAGEIFPDSDENGTEQIFDGASNINRNALAWSSGDGRVGGQAVAQKGPVRAGIFAETATNRSTSGASYYGAMELSGNLHEMIITIGRSQGRQFLGTHGDGKLATLSGYQGNATNTDWPGIDTTDSSRGVTGTVGSGYRGGDFQSTSIRHFQVSSRSYAAKDPDSHGYAQRYDAALGIFQGGRLGRTAP